MDSLWLLGRLISTIVLCLMKLKTIDVVSIHLRTSYVKANPKLYFSNKIPKKKKTHTH